MTAEKLHFPHFDIRYDHRQKAWAMMLCRPDHAPTKARPVLFKYRNDAIDTARTCTKDLAIGIRIFTMNGRLLRIE